MKQNAALEGEVSRLCAELDEATRGVLKRGYLFKFRFVNWAWKPMRNHYAILSPQQFDLRTSLLVIHLIPLPLFEFRDRSISFASQWGLRYVYLDHVWVCLHLKFVLSRASYLRRSCVFSNSLQQFEVTSISMLILRSDILFFKAKSFLTTRMNGITDQGELLISLIVLSDQRGRRREGRVMFFACTLRQRYWILSFDIRAGWCIAFSHKEHPLFLYWTFCQLLIL